MYEIHESTDSFFGKHSERNCINIHNQSVPQIVQAFDAALQDSNRKKTFSVNFIGGSHRKLIDIHDRTTIGNYSVTAAGEAFGRLANRVRQIDIFNLNPRFDFIPNRDFRTFVHLRWLETSGVLPEARERPKNANIDSFEFIKLHCQNTLTEMNISSFDFNNGQFHRFQCMDQIRRFGHIISGFNRLKSLDISSFHYDEFGFALFLDTIKNNMQSLEALNLSDNIINYNSGRAIRHMLIFGNLRCLDMNLLTTNNEAVKNIIEGCCLSHTIGIAMMENTRGTTRVSKLYDLVVNKTSSGELKVFDFRFGDDELSIEQKQKMLEFRERNSERWLIARRLEADEIHTTDKFDAISRISWDTAIRT